MMKLFEILNMILAGVSPYDLEEVIKHSMMFIDVSKYKLNHKQSQIDNRINYLQKKYKKMKKVGDKG